LPKTGKDAALTSFGIKEKVGNSLSEINVTPFVDVMLVLLIIFIITAPMLSSSVEVNLPQTTLKSQESRERLIVTITRDKKLFIQNRSVTYQDLGDQLKQFAAGAADKSILLRADRNLDYGTVLLIMARIREAGIEEVGLATEPLPE
jgi:biopolymer transport protein TolR